MGLKVSYSKDLFPGKNLVSHWPGLCDTKVFPGKGLWCHTAEGAASVTPKWVSLRLALKAYMQEFGSETKYQCCRAYYMKNMSELIKTTS